MKKLSAEEITEILKTSKIFCEASREALLAEVQCAQLRHFEKGEMIVRAGSNESFIGVILSGRAEVTGGGRLRMSVLERGDIFGAVTLFGSSGFQRDITALCRCELIVFSREAMLRLLGREPNMTAGYIGYLSDRIAFLNSRIEAFTGDTAGIRLAGWLLGNENGGSALLGVSLTELAGFLNISRASLYRAFAELEDCNLAIRRGKEVFIPDKSALSEYVCRGASE